MMMHSARADDQTFRHWGNVFEHQDIQIIQMTPDEHDREAAFSQNITHLVGRLLDQLNLQESPIATQGYQSLLKMIDQTCHDSLELFDDIMHYNPYSSNMVTQFKQSMALVCSQHAEIEDSELNSSRTEVCQPIYQLNAQEKD